MRNIKFRAWDKQLKQFSCIFEDYRIKDINDYTDYEVMQYTGLEDKNGKEIYEGDVIKFVWEEDSCWGNEGTYKGFVRYCDGGYEVVYIDRQEYTPTKDGGWHPNSKSDGLQSFIRWTNRLNVEIIGNIHENPELLKGAE